MLEKLVFWAILLALPLFGLNIIKRALKNYKQGCASGKTKEGRFHYDKEEDSFMFYASILLYIFAGCLCIGFSLFIVAKTLLQMI